MEVEKIEQRIANNELKIDTAWSDDESMLNRLRPGVVDALRKYTPEEMQSRYAKLDDEKFMINMIDHWSRRDFERYDEVSKEMTSLVWALREYDIEVAK